MQKNNIFIVSGPSGVGEDSVIQGLGEYLPTEKIVTSTTRKMREGDIQGKQYYFITKEEFQKNIKEGKMAEWAQEYNNNFYGVTKKELERVANLKDKIGIWKIEYKGVITAKEKFPEIKSVFIAPPDLETLIRRIKKRNPEISDEYIQERMDYTKKWLEHRDIYDFEVINEEGKLEETIQKVADFIKANINNEEFS